MPSLPLVLEDTMAQLKLAIPALNQTISPLTGSEAQPLEDILSAIPNPVQRAKLLISLAFALQSSLHALLRVNGQDTSQPTIVRQVERLKTYFAKIKRADREKKRPKTDTVAAGRFIKAALTESDDHQVDQDTSSSPNHTNNNDGDQLECDPVYIKRQSSGKREYDGRNRLNRTLPQPSAIGKKRSKRSAKT